MTIEFGTPEHLDMIETVLIKKSHEIERLKAMLDGTRTLLDSYAFQGDKIAGVYAKRIAELLDSQHDVDTSIRP